MIVVSNLAIRVAAAIFSVPPDVFHGFLPMVAPPPVSSAEAKRRQAVDFLFVEHNHDNGDNKDDYPRNKNEWWNRQDGYQLPGMETQMVDAQKFVGELSDSSADETPQDCSPPPPEPKQQRHPSTYGEVTPLGARQLFSLMGMTSRQHSQDEGIVFMDLGSGVGKLVIQTYLELPFVSRAIGIELAPTRHAAAVRAWRHLQTTKTAQRIRSMGVEEDVRCTDSDHAEGDDHAANCSLESSSALHQYDGVEFWQGDLFSCNLLSEATHIYVASLCFTDAMMEHLAVKLASEAHRLKCVASLQPLPLFDKHLNQLEFVEMSWTKPRGEGCPVYIYTFT